MTEKQQAECTIESEGTGVFVSSRAFGSPSEASPARLRPERAELVQLLVDLSALWGQSKDDVAMMARD